MLKNAITNFKKGYNQSIFSIRLLFNNFNKFKYIINKLKFSIIIILKVKHK